MKRPLSPARVLNLILGSYALMMTVAIVALWGFQDEVRRELRTAQTLEAQYVPTLTLLQETQTLLTSVQSLVEATARQHNTVATKLDLFQDSLCRITPTACPGWNAK